MASGICDRGAPGLLYWLLTVLPVYQRPAGTRRNSLAGQGQAGPGDPAASAMAGYWPHGLRGGRGFSHPLIPITPSLLWTKQGAVVSPCAVHAAEAGLPREAQESITADAAYGPRFQGTER